MSDTKTEQTAIPPHVEHFISYAHALAERIVKVLDKENSAAGFVALGMVLSAEISRQPETDLPREVRELRERLHKIIAIMVRTAPEVTVQ